MSRALQLLGYGKGLNGFRNKLLKTRQGARGGQKSFVPTDVSGLVSWFRFNTGITVTGSGVSEWFDQSGNGRHLAQSIDADRPFHETDGSILFDGVSEFLRITPFTYEQPLTIFLLAEPISWTPNDYIYDGATADTCGLSQLPITPIVFIIAGGAGISTAQFTVGTYSIMTAVFNGASSFIQTNLNTPITGDTGTDDPGGFILGAKGNSTNFAHMRAKECFMYDSVISSADITRAVDYLNNVGGVF